MIPSEFYIFYNSLTDGEQKEMMYLPYQMVESIEKSSNLSIEALWAPLESITPSFKTKLYTFCDEIKNRTRQINGNGKKFLVDFFNTIILIYKKLINDSNSNEENVYELGYNIIKEYLNLSDEDRLSFAKPFPTLSNLFNNPKALNLLRGIEFNSTYDDYINLKNGFKNLLLTGQLSPMNN
uniref:Uncharacterized protein n=1 Tax=Parastrongyloides trichosuri TaxID=131310 RepID=A0A0N4Z1V2_PARTI